MTVKYVDEAQERLDDAIDALTRMALGDPREARALQEFADAQVALASVRRTWCRADTYTRVDPGTGREHPLGDADWPSN